jgi:signal transduction histidine kinase
METMPNLASVMSTPRPLVIRDGSPSSFLSRFLSQLIIPLSADGEFLGTIQFASTAANRYGQNDVRIGYMLSLQLSSAIRNARLVAALEATRHELKMRVEELDAYGHTIAHDLKSPLSSIMVRTQMVMRYFSQEVPPKVLETMTSIEDSGRLMSRMIDQLLMLAKLRHEDAAPVFVDTRSAIERVLQRFDHLIESSGVKVEVAPDLPPTHGQEQWIEEIFANLISNAIKYMGQDNPHPTVYVRGKPEGSTVRYEIEDTGMGIKPEDLSRLFQTFSRLHVDSGIEGTGLGLSIVLRIIRKLNGDIGVESTYGKGTTFWLRLPAAPDS